MKPLVQDVLIGFVTTHDPASGRGPANIMTVAKAKCPQVIYLLHTEDTQENRQALLEWLQADPELRTIEVPDWPRLNLPDVTDYESLAEVLAEEVKKIARRHPGAHFHLVSGLPQARIIFALCLHTQLLSGTLWEVSPESSVSQPYKPPPPQKLDKRACEQRLKRWPTAIFDRFRDMFLEKFKKVRLRLDLRAEQAWLDGSRMDLRAAAPRRGEPNEVRPRTFQTLVLLAAKKRYGSDDQVDKDLIFKTAYSDQKHQNAVVNIRRALNSINGQARRLSKPPLKDLILDVKHGRRPTGIYRLTDELTPADETIEFIGNVRDYLRKMGVPPSDLSSLFPDLPAQEIA